MDEARMKARKSARSSALNELARRHPSEFARIYQQYRVAVGIEKDPGLPAWNALFDLLAGECRRAGYLPP